LEVALALSVTPGGALPRYGPNLPLSEHPPAATPLVSGLVIGLLGHHSKIRGDGYRAGRP
jgi:hypothetical protein